MSNKKLIIYGLIVTLIGFTFYFRTVIFLDNPISPLIVNSYLSEEDNLELGETIKTKKRIIRTIAEANKEFATRAESTLKPAFEKSGLLYPPKSIALLFFKQEKKMELWSKKEKKWVFVKEYEIKAASGVAGPKLKEGDFQVPEGIYKIELLNPNSNYHVSMKVNYPNEFDLANAKADGRDNLGGDIYIHGKALSSGCLAMGDDASEQLFVLVNQVGIQNVKVIISPNNSRPKSLSSKGISQPIWLPKLYADISQELKNFTTK